MSTVLLILVALLESAGAIAALFLSIGKKKSSLDQIHQALNSEVEVKRKMSQDLEALYAQMVPMGPVKEKALELQNLKDALKAERGRITITQAELETVEARLRELEEIERELEASGIETKEELKILKKKERDLQAKNDALKEQISASLQQMDQILNEVEMSSQVQEQVIAMKTELVQSEEKINALLLQIEQGNEQYFSLKRRYDALDIEYAQLYEKFSETEAATPSS